MKELGKLDRVDARTIWKHEAHDFTPWLAKDENIQRLGDAIGIELAVEGTEVDVGPFAADIVAKDTATGDFVVIENQLERTDHDHLGKAITYAAALGATAIVWIARRFTDEHQRALDWLNENSSDDIAFYGVRIDVWRIGDSPPALQLNVLVRPAEIRRENIKSISQGELSPTKELQFEFWTAFRDALAETGEVASLRTPRPQYWYTIALGRSGRHLSLAADTWGKRVGVRLYLSARRGGRATFDVLYAQREAIEQELGAKLEWDPNPEAKDKTIVLFRDADIEKRGEWPEYVSWLVKWVLAFKRVFGPRIRNESLGGGEGD